MASFSPGAESPVQFSESRLLSPAWVAVLFGEVLKEPAGVDLGSGPALP